MVDAFIHSRELPENMEYSFVQSLADILRGLQKVVVKKEDLQKRISSLGPASPDEFKKTLVGYVDELTRGKDPAKVRIVLED